MRLVADTSLLVGELLRVGGRLRLNDDRLEMFIPEQMRDELDVELPRRVGAFARRHGLSGAMATALLEAAIEAVDANIGVLEQAVYAAMEEEATWRSARDLTDWPLVACALGLDAGVWTNDEDLFGTGVSTWVSQTVQGWLDHQLAPA